jgi:membrane protease YdiL (CAAX protease family)
LNTFSARRASPLAFFLLTFVLSVPFWLFGAATGIELLPGLPAAALITVCPAAAALILVYRENKTAGMTALLKRSFDYKRIAAKAWYFPILLLAPLVMVISFGTMRLTGVAIPAPQFSVPEALALFAAFFIGALGEELGWSGYAIDPMQARWGALAAAVLLGLVWAAFHFVPLLQEHRSAAWIAWWSLGTVAMRVIMVWIYNNTGKSVFAVTLVHAMSNTCWQLFPVHGSHFDPRINGLIMAVLAAIVTIIWGPRRLARR